MYTDLTNTLVKEVERLVTDPFLIDEVYTLKFQFDMINEAYSAVHDAISHSEKIESSSIPSITNSIETYMRTFRRVYPQKIVPKQHILEKHCIPFIEKHKFGLGMLGEQGTELSHQTMHKLESRARGIIDKKERMSFVFKTHLLQLSPKLRLEVNKKSDDCC